ncbi:unannotated protein [freshwater metagenome]|uniref:Unannotated protein n=1 Tax=freshwater metagenome TaxID=449393 RepID=A0A6J7JTR4_9ZZZZ|nr:hypothetical protein [Actinomycetota bacterium]
MSAPPTDVVDRLQRLAAGAPGAGGDPDALWTRGRRRQRVRAGGVAAALVLVGLVGATTTPSLVERSQQVEPARTDKRMVLPDVIRQPGAWEPAFPSAPGKLSAVAMGVRGGLLSDRTALWGVSATTGESRFLDLPVAEQAVLSSDGSKLAYWASTGDAGESADGRGAVPTSVQVLDLVTGEQQGWDPAAEHGLMVAGLAWAGDTLWFAQGAFEDAEQDGAQITTRTWRWGAAPERVDGPYADDVGLRTVSQDPGGFLAASGTAATDARRVDDDGSVSRIRFVTDKAVTMPHMSPDGIRVAGLEQERERLTFGAERLVVGTVDDGRAVMERVRPIGAQEVLGWRSPTEVVVLDASAGGDTDGDGVRETRELWVADLSDLDRPGYAPWIQLQAATPHFAADAFAGDVVDAPDAPFAPDPRLVGLGLLAGAFVAWRLVVRVRRRRGDA